MGQILEEGIEYESHDIVGKTCKFPAKLFTLIKLDKVQSDIVGVNLSFPRPDFVGNYQKNFVLYIEIVLDPTRERGWQGDFGRLRGVLKKEFRNMTVSKEETSALVVLTLLKIPVDKLEKFSALEKAYIKAIKILKKY